MENYDVFSTTADVGIRIQGIGYEGLFRSAIKGLNLLYYDTRIDDPKENDGSSLYRIELQGDSLENILVNLLSEIVFLVQNKNKTVTGIIFHEATTTFLNADFVTIPSKMAPDLEIKAVTYHNLRIEYKEDILLAEIIFDI
jgi:SHS2 domain-containing protein